MHWQLFFWELWGNEISEHSTPYESPNQARSTKTAEYVVTLSVFCFLCSITYSPDWIDSTFWLELPHPPLFRYFTHSVPEIFTRDYYGPTGTCSSDTVVSSAPTAADER